MKKSRIAKLALMGASVAALAATLTTSTYAWYVSNKTANVNPVTGSTAAGTSDNTIAVSNTGARNDFHKSISLTNKTSGLSPVLRKNATLTATGAVGAAYYGLNDAGSTVVLKDSAETGGWYTYEFYMLASVNCSVSAVLTVTNTTTNFTTLTQRNYSNAGAGNNKITGVGVGETFTIDALQACRMSLAIETGAFASAAAEAAYGKADQITVPAEYTALVSEVATVVAPAASTTGYGSTHPTAGAHDYYEFMTNKTLEASTREVYGASPALTDTGLRTFSLTADTPVRLLYSLWLDGASDLCFNACQGQTLSVEFNYTATPTK